MGNTELKGMWTMKRLLFLAMLIMLTGTSMVSAQTAAKLNVAYVLAGSDIYYQKGFEVFETLAKGQGWSVTKVSSDYDPKKETNNVQDMVAKKVDAIVLCTVNSSNGAAAAMLANKAGIPVFFITALPDPDGPGVPTGSVSGPWYQAGVEDGKLMGAKFGSDAKIVLIEGAYGQGSTELHRAGLLDALGQAWKKSPVQVFQENVVFNQTGGWVTDKAQNVMQDALVKTGGKFDAVFVANEAMKDGVVKALQSVGKKYPIYTINGQEGTIEQIKKGIVEATVSIPPTSEADLVFQQVKAKFSGQKFPVYVKNVIVPISAANVSTVQVLPWTDSAKYVKMALDKQTGVDLSALKDTGPTDPDWTAQVSLNGAKSK